MTRHLGCSEYLKTDVEGPMMGRSNGVVYINVWIPYGPQAPKCPHVRGRTGYGAVLVDFAARASDPRLDLGADPRSQYNRVSFGGWHGDEPLRCCEAQRPQPCL